MILQRLALTANRALGPLSSTTAVATSVCRQHLSSSEQCRWGLAITRRAAGGLRLASPNENPSSKPRYACSYSRRAKAGTLQAAGSTTQQDAHPNRVCRGHILLGNTSWRPQAMAESPLEAADDLYDGIIIFDSRLPDDTEEFASRLDHSLEVGSDTTGRF